MHRSSCNKVCVEGSCQLQYHLCMWVIFSTVRPFEPGDKLFVPN